MLLDSGVSNILSNLHNLVSEATQTKSGLKAKGDVFLDMISCVVCQPLSANFTFIHLEVIRKLRRGDTHVIYVQKYEDSC